MIIEIDDKAKLDLEIFFEMLEEYFEDKEDADFVDGRYVPNEEMRLLIHLKNAKLKLKL